MHNAIPVVQRRVQQSGCLARRSGQRDDATTDEVGNLIRRIAVFAQDWFAVFTEAR